MCSGLTPLFDPTTAIYMAIKALFAWFCLITEHKVCSRFKEVYGKIFSYSFSVFFHLSPDRYEPVHDIHKSLLDHLTDLYRVIGFFCQLVEILMQPDHLSLKVLNILFS